MKIATNGTFVKNSMDKYASCLIFDCDQKNLAEEHFIEQYFILQSHNL